MGEYHCTIDHILIDCRILRKLVVEGGVLMLDIPTDHRLTLIKLKTSKINSYSKTNNDIKKKNKVKYDFSKLRYDKRLFQKYEYEFYKELNCKELIEMQI